MIEQAESLWFTGLYKTLIQINFNKILINVRALVGGGARGAIVPPTFLDLLNKYQFLPKNSNFFKSTSTPNLKMPTRALDIFKDEKGSKFHVDCHKNISLFVTTKKYDFRFI